jgi:subtilisin family serine protease
MRKACVIALLLLSVCLFGEVVPREMVFKTSQPTRITRGVVGLPDFDSFLANHSVREIKPITTKPDNQFFVARFNSDLDWNAIQSTRPSFSGIEYIQPNYLNTLYLTPNDPYFPNQQFDLVNFPEAWELTTGSRQVIVGLIDSGLLFDHPDLQTNIYTNPGEGTEPDGIDNDGNGFIDDIRGWDFVDAPEEYAVGLGDFIDCDNDPTDENSHGTHVGGIIAADANNGEGICGGAWQVRLLVCRAGFRTTEGSGYLQDDDCAAAIIYAVDMGADVLNFSWGDQQYSQLIADACLYAYERGVVIVASSGNTPENGISYPARLSTTIAVGAVDANLSLASFSCYGPELDVVAPGSQILSTYGDTPDNYYAEQSGTSMAAPFVSGAVALLLSQEPELSIAEVSARLASSSYDLGDEGFDNHYGWGLLDAHALLQPETVPHVEIGFPEDNSGYSTSFDILGTVTAPTFFRYTVMYTEAALPEPEDWFDVTNAQDHDNTPTFYNEPVDNGVLAHFTFNDLFPGGTYIIRVELTLSDGTKYDTRKTVYIDQTPPELYEQKLSVMKRWNGELPEYYMYVYYDEPVNLSASCRGSDGVMWEIASNNPDSIQVLRIPDSVPTGAVSVSFRAVNLCGLSAQSSTFTNFCTVDRDAIDVNAYRQETVGPPLYGVSKPLKNENGMLVEDPDGREFVAMQVSEGYGPVSFYKLNGNQMTSSNTFTYYLNGVETNRLFKPLDVGNTNDSGLEVLGLNLDISTLYETITGYPSYPANADAPMSGVLGGILADYDQDGVDDLITVETGTSARTINMYKRTGNLLVPMTNHTLGNPTETDSRNNFVPSLVLDDLDGDAYPDLLAADTDGDVLVYEIHPDTDVMVYTTRIPVPDAYYLGTGHFTEQRTKQFVVGGSVSNDSDPNRTYWFFEFFRKTANNNYEPFQYLAFDNVQSQNSIAVSDIDNDGLDELILALAPNLFIADLVNGEMQPVWKGQSFKTYQAIAFPKTDTQDMALVVSWMDGDSLRSSLVTPNDPFDGPATPEGLTANPMNQSQVSLSWLASDVDAYNIYRRQGDQTSLLITVTTNSYTDTGLTTGTEYEYAISAIDNDYPTTESRTTLWKSATPDYPPTLTSVTLANVNTLRLQFDRMLDNTGLNLGIYSVNHDIGHPVSAVFTQSQFGVLLHFYGVLPEYSDYSVTITGLKGKSGVPFPDGVYSFTFQDDSTSPSLSRFEVIDARTVRFVFTEELNDTEAGDLSRYEVIPPSVDPTNTLARVQYADSSVVVTLNKDIEYSNQPYYLVMTGIHDLVGNAFANNADRIRFYLAEISDLSHVAVYPNPLKVGQENTIRFINLPLEHQGSIYIYNLSGELVFKDTISPLTQNQNYYSWNTMNSMRKKVSSGSYFYILKMGNDTKRGVVSIIR